MQLRRKPLICFLMLFICLNSALAESRKIDWSGEVYGGRYYDDKRLGTYFVLSKETTRGPTIAGEVLVERNTDYDFAGVGGHIYWPVEKLGNIGLIASQSWESYEYLESGENQELDYRSRTLGVEWELEMERIAIAVQAGNYDTGYDDSNQNYLSAELYFWGPELNWYLRGATGRASGKSYNTIEGYRIFNLVERPVTAYLGVSTIDAQIVSLKTVDSIYAGTYVELFTTSTSTMTFWAEVAEQDDETLLTLELNLAFGPGARTPYVTAFGFSLND